MNDYLAGDIYSAQSYTVTIPIGPTQPSAQPTTPWWQDPRLQPLLQLPNSALLAALPEPPAFNSRQFMYNSICSMADMVLAHDGPDVMVHTIEHVADGGSFSAGLLVNGAEWAVSRVCHDHLSQVGPKLAAEARRLLRL